MVYPFDAATAIPSWHYQAHRSAVIFCKRFRIQLRGEECVRLREIVKSENPAGAWRRQREEWWAAFCPARCRPCRPPSPTYTGVLRAAPELTNAEITRGWSRKTRARQPRPASHPSTTPPIDSSL